MNLFFQFYHKEDMLWVLNGGPLAFDNAIQLVDVIPPGIDPLKVQLWHLNIWIQIHDLPNGFMTGCYKQYDSWMQNMYKCTGCYSSTFCR